MANGVYRLLHFPVIFLWRVGFDREIDKPVGCLNPIRSRAVDFQPTIATRKSFLFQFNDRGISASPHNPSSSAHIPQLVHLYISHLLFACITFLTYARRILPRNVNGLGSLCTSGQGSAFRYRKRIRARDVRKSRTISPHLGGTASNYLPCFMRGVHAGRQNKRR